MEFTDIINILLALVSIGFGVIGWLAPRYTMEVLDMTDGGSTMGMSEIRAASGAVFVAVGIGALILGTPEAYAMIGFVWAGGALGRVTSLVLDQRTRLKWIFFATELVVAVIALAVNL